MNAPLAVPSDVIRDDAPARHAPRGRLVRVASGALALAVLGGCASAEKRACESGEWDELGFRDGRAGLGFERVGVLADRCSDYDIAVDSAAWADGHARGLGEYCEPGRGFDLGEGGEEYSGNCPAALEGRFLSSYVRGMNIRSDELDLAYERSRRDLDDARWKREALDPDDGAGDLDDRIDELENALEENLATRRELNQRIGRWSREL